MQHYGQQSLKVIAVISDGSCTHPVSSCIEVAAESVATLSQDHDSFKEKKNSLGKFQLLVNVNQVNTASQQTDRIPVSVMDDQMSNRFLRGYKSMLKIAALLCA